VNYVADGQFGDFSGTRARNIGNGDNVARHMPRCGAAADSRLDGARQFVIEDSNLLPS
jgi:hypothetical protein